MEFRTEVHIPPSGKKISYRSGILFMGSCFTENIGAMMKELQFPVEVNPFGINYNPSSVARNLWSLLNGKEFREDDLDTRVVEVADRERRLAEQQMQELAAAQKRL